MSSRLPRQIVISGAGLAGSLLAVMLGRRGYEVTVYEKRPDLRHSRLSAGRSINLALADRGIDALRRAGLYDDLERLLIPMRGRMIHERSGQLEFQPYGQRDHEIIHSVSRGDLNGLMMDRAELHPRVSMHFEQACQRIDLKNRTLEILDQRNQQLRRVEYDVLIGADGVGSPVRKAILRATGGNCSTEMLDHDYKELVLPPVRDGQHAIEREALHIWPRGGFMLIALPNPDGSYTVTLFLAKHGSPSFDELRSREHVRSFFCEEFPDVVPLIPDLTDQFFKHALGPLGTIRCWPWSAAGNALVLGDAAHAIVPFHGQGMNAAFEDCAQLIQLLNEYEDDWPTVMHEFEQQRKPNADAIADMALENYVIMRERVVDPKFQLKKQIGFQLEQRFPNRFIPRYSMVMFHTIAYAQALQRGRIQERILDELSRGINSVEQVDFTRAEALVAGQLSEMDVVC